LLAIQNWVYMKAYSKAIKFAIFLSMAINSIVFTACADVSKEDPQTKARMNVYIEPKKWFGSWGCGNRRCNENQMITVEVSEVRDDGGLDYMFQTMIDSNAAYNSMLYLSDDRCEVIASDTIYKNSSPGYYGLIKKLYNEFKMYKGEIKDKTAMCIDGPIQTISWGEDFDCNYSYWYCNDLSDLVKIKKNYEIVLTKILFKNDSLSPFDRWNRIRLKSQMPSH